MKRPFVKMQGCGNDYIYFDCLREELLEPEKWSVKLSDRHFGIGGDGIVLICPSETADAKMRMFNADGSEGKMCGNAIRCVGKYLYESKAVSKKDMTIETLSGVKRLLLTISGQEVSSVTVDMGAPIWKACQIPTLFPDDRVIDCPLRVNGEEYRVTCVSMGNPHCVLFMDEVEDLPIETIGPQFESHPIFPERVNTEFIKVIRRNELRMRVWERGSGETWACGTGACAAVAAAIQNGYCDKETDVTVHLNGGDLIIREAEDTIWMTGAAVKVFEGIVEL